MGDGEKAHPVVESPHRAMVQTYCCRKVRPSGLWRRSRGLCFCLTDVTPDCLRGRVNIPTGSQPVIPAFVGIHCLDFGAPSSPLTARPGVN